MFFSDPMDLHESFDDELMDTEFNLFQLKCQKDVENLLFCQISACHVLTP